jgi:hypothetical protein
MMESSTVITLLTVAVTLLSAVIIVMIVVAIVVLLKIKQMTKKLNIVLANASKATAWFAPAKLFSEARRAFHK